jgi:hypothetical protein
MKQVKDFNGEVIKAEEGSPIQPFHAYISLMLGMLKEPFVSSDAKYLMIQSSYGYLRDMGYSDDEIEIYIEKIREVVKTNIEINSFMG